MQLRRIILRGFVIEGGVEAQFIAKPCHFLIVSGDADHAAPLDLGNLAGDGANCAGRSRDNDGFSRARLADIQQTEIRREPGDAEDAERGRDRRERRIELAHAFGI